MRFLRHICTLLAVAVFLMAAACSREHEPDKVVGNTSFTAVSDAFDFVSGDKIAVKDAPGSFAYTAEGRFVGDVLQWDDYYAVYPYSALKYFSPTEPVVAVMTVPVVQDALRNDIPRDRRISVAHASDSEKHFDFSEPTRGGFGTCTNTNRKRYSRSIVMGQLIQ